jgi:uncharacterized low-complexity protein
MAMQEGSYFRQQVICGEGDTTASFRIQGGCGLRMGAKKPARGRAGWEGRAAADYSLLRLIVEGSIGCGVVTGVFGALVAVVVVLGVNVPVVAPLVKAA